MPHILHINDHNLLLQNTLEQGGDIVLQSQGYAWLKDDSVLFDINHDSAPVEHCRLAPQQINNRYWQQCAQTAIASNGAGMRHAADLIWKHLSELKTKADLTELAVVVPANYRDTHLQLLLGVAKAAGLTVTALINKPALMASSQGLPEGDVKHIDVQLHQTIISTLSISDGNVILESVDTKPELGIHSAQESLLQALQGSFIRADRFDPLHDAATEQQLFQQLSTIVDSAVRGEKATVGVQHLGKLYSTVIEAGEIGLALNDLISLVKANSAKTSIIDMNGSFDLAPLIGDDNPHTIWASTPAPLAAKQADGRDDGGNVIYQTTWPNKTDHAAVNVKPKSRPKSVSKPNLTVAADSASATHLMQFGIAIPIERAVISIDDAKLSIALSGNGDGLGEMLKSGRLHIINDPDRSSLRANDRLMSPLADGVITALSVTD